MLLSLVVLAGTAAVASPWAWREVSFRHHLRTARVALDAFVADNAVMELNAAEKLRPNSAEVQYLLGMANRKAGRLDHCRSHLERAATLGWPNKEVRLQLTLLAFQAGDRQAEAELRRSMLLPMTDEVAEETYESLAIGYLAEYRVSEADLVLDYWIRWRPKRARPRLLRAEIFAITRQHHERLEQYEQVLAVDPENYAAHLGMAHVLLGQHDAEGALARYRWCSDHWPGDLAPPLGIAACYQHQGKLTEAKQVLRAVLEKRMSSDQRAHVLAELAKVVQQERDFPAAIALLTESVQLNPYSEQAEYTLSMCLAKVGRREEAERHTRRSKEIEKAQQQLADVELQMLSQPDDAELRYQAGLALTKLGNPKASAAMMLAALRWDPLHSGAHAELVKYYEEIGRSDLAREHQAFAVKDGAKTLPTAAVAPAEKGGS